MKKTSFLFDTGYRVAMLSMMALFVVTGCSAHPSNAGQDPLKQQARTDSVMLGAVGDSVYKIITEAKKIKAEEIKLHNDLTQTVITTPKDVKGKYIPLIKFVLSNPKIYGGNTTVYGQFMPCFKLTFIKKKEVCIINFDFGLKKWNVCDSNGRVIKMFDLSTVDMLRIANMLFPENDLYKKQINSEKR